MPILPNDTLSSIVNLVNRANPDPVVKPPLSNTAFTLDSSGVVGFFGDESAVRAMSTVNLVSERRWLGWYNSPGSYEVAKQFSRLANSHIFDALFPVGDRDPAKVLMLDGRVGPEHTLLYIPSKRAPEPIGHLGSLIASKVSQMPANEGSSTRTKHTMDKRITFVKLGSKPDRLQELTLCPSSESSTMLANSTILISIGGCVACALIADWFCLASIALGIIANGLAHLAISSGKLYLTHDPPALSEAYIPGDVMLRNNTDIIVVIGLGSSVAPLTRGRFLLHFGEMSKFPLEQVQSGNVYDSSEPLSMTVEDPMANTPTHTFLPPLIPQKYHIDVSVILLLSQFLAQLLLIPQGKLFGQLMFIGTLVPSWVYHSYMSSLSLDLQTQALFRTLDIKENDIYQCNQLNTWTQTAVFACLVFRSIHPPVIQLWSTTTADSDRERPEDAPVREEEANMLEEAKKVWMEAEKVATEGTGAETQQERSDASFAEYWNEVQGEGWKKAENDRRAQLAKKADNALRALLDGLLPGQTDVWRAFKESLVRRLSKIKTISYSESQWAYMEGNNPFEIWSTQDMFASQPNSQRFVVIHRDDLKQLRMYQQDAKIAFDMWRTASLTKITETFQC